MSLYAGIEAGGTKFVCAISDGGDRIRDEAVFSTGSYLPTMENVIAYLDNHHRRTPLNAIGISSFGPIDLAPTSPTYGFITSTPKRGWKNVDLVGPISKHFGIPVGLDTDVNGAAMAEYYWGTGMGLDTLVYITVGTGIGGGGIINGKPMHGLVHPEMGHMLVPQDRAADPFEGVCPFHKNCLEGLASGPAIMTRWGKPGQYLSKWHAAWELEAKYLTYCLVNTILCLSPQMIILGGGVMKQTQLFAMIRKNVQELLNQYVRSPLIQSHIDDYIVPSALGSKNGVLGGIALARHAAAVQPEPVLRFTRNPEA